MKGVTPVLLIALSVGIFVFYIQPEYEEMKVLQAEKQQYDEAIEASLRFEEKRNELLNKYNNFSTADVRRLEKFLPERVDDVRLILDITSIAQDNSIDVAEIELVEELGDQAGASDARSGNDSSLLRNTEVNLETLALNFNFEATYGQFLDFVNDLESSLRIMDIIELGFAPVEGSSTRYSFDITLQTYWLQ